ncbi:MAG TPA: hypothetical protein PKG48_08385 [Bacteroidales bacterium]|nr:hypothetical protein [Bacteroidales bacterium]
MKRIVMTWWLVAWAVLVPMSHAFAVVHPGGSGGGLKSSFAAGIRIDGRMTDWPTGLFYISSEAQAMYAVANDSSNLYFCLQMADESSQATALRGVTVWIDPAGKKKETCSLRISAIPMRPEGDGKGGPGPNRQMTGNPPARGERPAGMKGMKGGPGNRPLSGRMNASGFREKFNTMIPVPGPDSGLCAAMALDSTGVLVIEGKIPLSALPVDARTAKALTFGFGVEVNNMSGPEGAGQGGMHGGGGPQGGMGREGGMEGGMGGGMNSGMEGGGGGHPGGRHEGQGGMDGQPGKDPSTRQTKLVKTWYKFTLAPPPAAKGL